MHDSCFRLKPVVVALLLFTGLSLYGQDRINGYEYWFNTNYTGRQSFTLTPTENFHLTESIDVSELPLGVNKINIRFRDEEGLFSGTIEELFYKMDFTDHSGNLLTGYEYWFNNNYGERQVMTTGDIANFHVINNIDVSSLPDGVNMMNIRFRDSNGTYSSTISDLFYKIPVTDTSENLITGYEYWFNNDYNDRQVESDGVTGQYFLTGSIDVSSLPDGVNVLNIRFRDSHEAYSSTLTTMFLKAPQDEMINNKIIAYKYWFNDSHENATLIELETPVEQYFLTGGVDMTKMAKGRYGLHIQLIDSRGVWSSVTTDSITKLSLPVADFDFTTDFNCDTTTYHFNNLSIDGDVYLWDFGDGYNHTLANPSHIYVSPGVYNISLTATDTITMTDSTKTTTVTVKGKTYSTLEVTECFSYTSPGGSRIWTTSGLYYDTIPNHFGCDSIITINLTIKSVDTGVTPGDNSLTANATDASFQWLDCNDNHGALPGETGQTFIPDKSGMYAVEVFQNGCRDTSACYVINLTGVTESSFAHEILVFPNPTTGQVKIDMGESIENCTIMLRDMSGRLVKRSNHSDLRVVELDINSPPGVYLLTIMSSDKRRATIKIMKR